MQRRRGPNVVGFFGSSQPSADGSKSSSKETVLPSSANLAMFVAAPITTFTLSSTGRAVSPSEENMVFADINTSTSHISAVPPSGVYGVPPSGWASNSKYAFLGALRSAAQMVSYEASIGLIPISVISRAGPSNFSDTVIAQQNIRYRSPSSPSSIMLVIPALAETNRHPSDLPEAEAESVAGYSAEHPAMGFASSFPGESANILFMCSLTTVSFLGGWFPLPAALGLDLPVFNWVPGFI